MGGAAALAAAAQSPDVAAVATDGTYASILDELPLRAKAHRYPLTTMAARAGRGLLAHRSKASLDAGDALRNVAALDKTPALFIQGDADRSLSSSTAQALYDAKAGSKSLYMVPGGESGTSHKVAGQAYERRVQDFFQQAL
ncbi:Alpha/beta hydrolase family protein [compost metagenome]